MCGLSGAIGFDNINTFKKLHLNSEKRGYDSSGVVIIKNKEYLILKKVLRHQIFGNLKISKTFSAN